MPFERIRQVVKGRGFSPAIDFEAEGLLDGLEDEEAREARLRLLRELAADGVSLDELRQAVERDRLGLLPVERVLAVEGDRYTAEEVAEQSGLETEFVLRLWRAIGMPPNADERVATDQDIEMAVRVRRLCDAGMPDDGLVEIARVLGLGASRTAAAIREVFAGAFSEPGDTELDYGLRYAEAARAVGPEIAPLLEYALNVHQREQVGSEVAGRAEGGLGRLPGARTVTVGFADLEGFTRLGEEAAPDRLGAVANRLAELATDVARPPVRLVKMIGDAAMFVSVDPDALVDAALGLMDLVARESEEFPAVRVGMATGEAISRGGEWYGRPVNVAARVTAAASPGEAIATVGVRDAVEGTYAWAPAGRRRLKGIRGSWQLLQVSRASLDGGPPWPGYDDQPVETIRKVLSESDERLAEKARRYEARRKQRTGILGSD